MPITKEAVEQLREVPALVDWLVSNITAVKGREHNVMESGIARKLLDLKRECRPEKFEHFDGWKPISKK